MNDNHRRETFREHVRVVFPEVPGARIYALDDPAEVSLAAFTDRWQEARDTGFSRPALRDMLAELSVHIPGMVQQRPATGAPAATPTVWRDEVTNATARNPWDGDPSQQDVASQVAVMKYDPELGRHLQRLARDGGVTYRYLVELREAEAKRLRRASFVYNAKTHELNPFRDPAKLTEQSRLMAEDKELGQFYQDEAKPLTFPWQVGNKNLTLMAKLSNANPAFGKLARQAETLLESWSKDELAVARQAEEQARAARVAAEMRLKVPVKLQ